MSATVTPLGPSRADLHRRQQLALSLLSHRGHTAEAAALVERVLRGESIDELREGNARSAG